MFSASPKVKTESPKSKVTLDTYFSKSSTTEAKKSSISVDDFFSKSAKEKPLEVKKSPSLSKQNKSSLTNNLVASPSLENSVLSEKSILAEDSLDCSKLDSPKTPKVKGKSPKTPSPPKIKKPISQPFKNIEKSLNGVTFVFTGQLESLEREEAQDYVEKKNGRVTKAVSKKTTYLVIGNEPGQSKIAKAESLNTKTLNEDEFLQLIGYNEVSTGTDLLSVSVTVDKDSLSAKPIVKTREVEKNNNLPQIKQVVADQKCETLWVEKYRPKAKSALIGHAGEKSPANKLYQWLKCWQAHFKSGAKAKSYNSAPPWASNVSDDGKWSRAVLISGPPGIGKTTSAHVICSELQFATVEMNASDCRSKTLMKENLADSLNMTDLTGFARGKSNQVSATKQALIMDEVDGMAGNQDRGGIQELIMLIKQTKMPIICLCNDRQSPKIRSLANYCFDLRFQRPRTEQIKACAMSISFKEGIEIPNLVLNNIIEASNHDIRQVINNMQLWSNSDKKDESAIISKVVEARKEIQLSPFEVIRKVFHPEFSGAGGKKAKFSEMMDLFFQDYSLGPLFVQDSYIKIKPSKCQQDSTKHLMQLAKAARDIATGDIIDKSIRRAGTGSWSLLPAQSVFSSVSPGLYVSGALPGGPGGVSFPAFFGKNSTQNKNSRIFSQLSNHLRISTQLSASSATSLVMDYVEPMAYVNSQLLKEGDVDSVLSSLISYGLLKEDFNNIMELSTWPDQKGYLADIDTKLKTALTRAYNKSEHLLPYAIDSSVSKNKVDLKSEFETDDADLLNNDEPEQNVENEDLSQFISKKKPAGQTKRVTTQPKKTGTSKKAKKDV